MKPQTTKSRVLILLSAALILAAAGCAKLSDIQKTTVKANFA